VKDIDFDELDRAVSSVLGQGAVKDDPATKTSLETSAANTTKDSSQVTVTSDEPEQVETAPAPSSPIVTSPSSSPTPSLAIKRRGKFMDVMHPSADMAPVAQAPQPVRPLAPLTAPETDKEVVPEPEQSVEVSAEGGTDPHEPTASLDETTVPVGAEPAPIEALLPDHVPDTDNAVEASTEPDVEAGPAQTEDEPEVERPSTSMYVDPLATQEKTEDVPVETDSSSASEAGAVDDTAASFPDPAPETSTEPTAQPPATPFLTDTNVDKRPLGAFVGPEQSSEATDTASPASLQPAMAMPGDRQSAPSVPLPRELQPDVVEVESVQEPEATAPANDDGRVEGHPLFDTSTYHEPIAAVHGHGMAAWVKWMIGLLLCLVVGAGVGYFLFAAGL
jgi:hypothetical protein